MNPGSLGQNPALQNMQMAQTLTDVAQSLAKGDIGSSLGQLTNLFTDLANDPVSQVFGNALGGVQPNFGNFTPPAQAFPFPAGPVTPRPLPQMFDGAQGAQDFLSQLQEQLLNLFGGLAEQPDSPVGTANMDDVRSHVDGMDFDNLMEGRKVTSGEHKGWTYGKINNEQEVKDVLNNELFAAQAGDGKISDTELLNAIDTALDRATTEGAIEELTDKERSALKDHLIGELDQFTSQSLGSTEPSGPEGPIPSDDGLQVQDNKVTTPGGYEVEFHDRGGHYDVTVTDPDGNKTHHWGDPHVSESDRSGAKQGETDYFWPDKNLSINLPDGSKISMHATGPKGVIKDAEVYVGDKYVSANASKDSIQLHEQGGRRVDATTPDGTQAYPGPPGEDGGVADLFVKDEPSGWKELGGGRHFDQLNQFFPVDTTDGVSQEELQFILTNAMNNPTDGAGGLNQTLSNAANFAQQAGIDLSSPQAQNWLQGIALQQLGGGSSPALPDWAQNAGGSGGGLSGIEGGTSFDGMMDTVNQVFDSTGSMSDKIQELADQGVIDPDQAAMMQLQQKMQKQNQMVSMITNLMKMLHDTQKAVIQNLRA